MTELLLLSVCSEVCAGILKLAGFIAGHLQ